MRRKIHTSGWVYNIIFTALMNLGMAFFISISVHIFNRGFEEFATIWMKNFVISTAVGFPIALVLVFVIDSAMKKMFIIDK